MLKYKGQSVIRKPTPSCDCKCHKHGGDLCKEKHFCCDDHWVYPKDYDWSSQDSGKKKSSTIYDDVGKMWGHIGTPQNRIMVGVPLTGLVRAEWMMARYGQVTPCNWSQIDAIRWLSAFSPIGFLVADARNSIVDAFIKDEFEWLFFIDHDTILPPGTLLKLNERMLENKIPIWSGLYFTKSVPAEPLVYRGRGNGYFQDWVLGKEVWVDAIPMGCTMIHRSILEIMYNEAEEYDYMGTIIRRVFESPAKTFYDPQTGNWFNNVGTEDIEWCNTVINNKVLKRAGWDEIAEKEFPFLIDTSIFCKHIDLQGVQYPAHGEHLQFVDKEEIKNAINKNP